MRGYYYDSKVNRYFKIDKFSSHYQNFLSSQKSESPNDHQPKKENNNNFPQNYINFEYYPNQISLEIEKKTKIEKKNFTKSNIPLFFHENRSSKVQCITNYNKFLQVWNDENNIGNNNFFMASDGDESLGIFDVMNGISLKKEFSFGSKVTSLKMSKMKGSSREPFCYFSTFGSGNDRSMVYCCRMKNDVVDELNFEVEKFYEMMNLKSCYGIDVLGRRMSVIESKSDRVMDLEKEQTMRVFSLGSDILCTRFVDCSEGDSLVLNGCRNGRIYYCDLRMKKNHPYCKCSSPVLNVLNDSMGNVLARTFRGSVLYFDIRKQYGKLRSLLDKEIYEEDWKFRDILCQDNYVVFSDELGFMYVFDLVQMKLVFRYYQGEKNSIYSMKVIGDYKFAFTDENAIVLRIV